MTAKRSGRTSIRQARKATQATPETTIAEPEVVTGDVVPATTAPDPNQVVAALLRDGAQGRGQTNLTLDQVPEPVDVGDKTGELDENETWMLSVCDRAVAEYARAEVVALKALLTVRERRLYRSEFPTFAEYAEQRLGHARSWAYKQLDRYEVSVAVSPIGDKLMIESQARELAPVLRNEGEGAVREIWRVAATEAGAADKVTATVIRQARDRRFPPDSSRATRSSQVQAAPNSPLAASAQTLGQAVADDKRDINTVVTDLRTQLRRTLPDKVFTALVKS